MVVKTDLEQLAGRLMALGQLERLAGELVECWDEDIKVEGIQLFDMLQECGLIERVPLTEDDAEWAGERGLKVGDKIWNLTEMGRTLLEAHKRRWAEN